MPPNPHQLESLAALLGLQSNAKNDPRVQTYNLHRQRRDEIRDRLSRGSAYNVGELQDLKTQLGFIDEDVEDTGIPGQARLVNSYLDRRADAIEKGFGQFGGDHPDPLIAQNQAGMSAQYFKDNAPVRAAQTKGEYELAIKREEAEANRRMLETARGPATLPGQRIRAPKVTTTMGPSGVTTTIAPPNEISVSGKKQIADITSAAMILRQVRDDIVDDNTVPPADAPPKGFLGQLGDVVKARGTKFLYGLPFDDPSLSGDRATAERTKRRIQYADLAKLMATAGQLRGVRNMAWIKQVQDHMARGDMPPAIMRQRIDELLAQYPALIDEIYMAEDDMTAPPSLTPPTGAPAAPSGQAPGNIMRRDPNGRFIVTEAGTGIEYRVKGR